MTLRRRLRLVLGADPAAADGFTLIEVLVAAIILTLGSIAVLTTFVVGIHNVQRGKETQLAGNIAQREMEKVRSLPFDEVALASAPTTSAEEENPDYRISGTSFYLKRSRTELAALCIKGSGECASSSIAATGKVVSGPSNSCVGGTSGSSFEIGGASGQVYCFVTVQKEPTCGTSTGAECVIKRVVVDVWMKQSSNAAHRQSYYELQSDFVDTEPG